jgi:hypothetical protein
MIFRIRNWSSSAARPGFVQAERNYDTLAQQVAQTYRQIVR